MRHIFQDGFGRLLLDFGKFIERLFVREPRLVYVGVANKQYKLVAFDIRKDVTTYLTPQALQNFVQVTPIIIVDALERLQPLLGEISSILVRYEKRVLLLSRFDDNVIVLGFEPSVPTPFPVEIAKMIKEVLTNRNDTYCTFDQDVIRGLSVTAFPN